MPFASASSQCFAFRYCADEHPRRRRSRFPLPLDAVVERKPAPERTAGMPAVGGRSRGRAAAPPTRSEAAASRPHRAGGRRGRPPPGSAVEARASAATGGRGRHGLRSRPHALAARLRAGGHPRRTRAGRASARVPRHLFMEPGSASQAYEDAALPIGHQQTISKPSVVARMIELLREGLTPRPAARARARDRHRLRLSGRRAEPGGARRFFSIERIRPLHEQAKANLAGRCACLTCGLHYGDGMLGLPQAAPFSSIILAAAGMEVPRGLAGATSRLAARLIAPVAVDPRERARPGGP